MIFYIWFSFLCDILLIKYYPYPFAIITSIVINMIYAIHFYENKNA